MAASIVCLEASSPLLSLPFPRSFFPKQRACSQAMYLLVSPPNERLVPVMKILWKIACFGSGSEPGGYSSNKSYRGASSENSLTPH